MTATVTRPDVVDVLRRADGQFAKRAGDDPANPEYLTALATAVRPLLGQSTAAPAKVDDVQVKQLLADKQRLETVVEEQRKILQSSGKEYDRIARENAAKDREINEARAARDTAVAQLREQGTSPHGALQLAQEDNVRLADELAAVQEQLSTTRRDLAAANKTLDEIADEEAGQPTPAHVHLYAPTKPGEQPGPCACKHPYPRAFEFDDDEVQPDVEPWSRVFDRIRAQLDEVTQ